MNHIQMKRREIILGSVLFLVALIAAAVHDNIFFHDISTLFFLTTISSVSISIYEVVNNHN